MLDSNQIQPYDKKNEIELWMSQTSPQIHRALFHVEKEVVGGQKKQKKDTESIDMAENFPKKKKSNHDDKNERNKMHPLLVQQRALSPPSLVNKPNHLAFHIHKRRSTEPSQYNLKVYSLEPNVSSKERLRKRIAESQGCVFRVNWSSIE